jgi:hypothetical protein
VLGDGESRRPIAPSVLETLAENSRRRPAAVPEKRELRPPRPSPAERPGATWPGRSTALLTAIASLALCAASWIFLREVRRQRRLMENVLRSVTAPEIAFVAPTGFDPDAANRLTVSVHNEGGPAEEVELAATVLCCAPIRVLWQRPHDVKSVAKASRSPRLARGKDAGLTLDLSGLSTLLAPAARDAGGTSAVVAYMQVRYTPAALTATDRPEPVTLAETRVWRPKLADWELVSDDRHELVDEFVRAHPLAR